MKKWIVSITSVLAGAVIGFLVTEKISKKEIDNKQEMSDKHLDLYLMMNQWVKVKQSGKSLATFFHRYGYKEIAIYGMSYAGETLVEEIEKSDIKVKYGIDQNAEGLYFQFDVVSPNDELENVDAIVVTPIRYFDAIEKMLSKKVNCPILSLDDILYEV